MFPQYEMSMNAAGNEKAMHLAMKVHVSLSLLRNPNKPVTKSEQNQNVRLVGLLHPAVSAIEGCCPRT